MRRKRGGKGPGIVQLYRWHRHGCSWHLPGSRIEQDEPTGAGGRRGEGHNVNDVLVAVRGKLAMATRDGSSLDSYSKDSYSSHFFMDSSDSPV